MSKRVTPLQAGRWLVVCNAKHAGPRGQVRSSGHISQCRAAKAGEPKCRSSLGVSKSAGRRLQRICKLSAGLVPHRSHAVETAIRNPQPGCDIKRCCPGRCWCPASAGARPPSAGRAPTTARSLRRLVFGIIIAGTSGLLILCCALLWALLGLPVDRAGGVADKPTLLLEAANGDPLGRVGVFTVADQPMQNFPAILIQAVLSTEDRRFYRHPGVDPLGILRAVHANRAVGEVVEGGSTITQQLVKMEYLTSDRTYIRKLREALMAMWLETHLSKDQILDRYLNRVYLGDGAYGMAAASQLYFNKRPADLTLAEAAMLAGLVKAPSELDPLHHLNAARARAATVLDAMVADHVIDEKAANAAKAAPATIKLSRQLAPARSWFSDWVAKSAVHLAGSQTGSVRVRTTLLPDLQNLAQRAVDDALAKQGRQLGVSQGALVAIRPDGAVLAMVGGRDYGNSQFSRAVDAYRQPGSAFKLFVYLAALRKGYTPQDTIDAGPIDIKGWAPANFDDEHYGQITLAEAFAKSVNTAAVRLAMDVGLDNVIAAARDLGITEPLPRLPSLALGSVGVSLVDMTGAFASGAGRPHAGAAMGSGRIGSAGRDADVDDRAVADIGANVGPPIRSRSSICYRVLFKTAPAKERRWTALPPARPGPARIIVMPGLSVSTNRWWSGCGSGMTTTAR